MGNPASIMGKMGYHPYPKVPLARSDVPQMHPKDDEMGIRYHPETEHDKVSRHGMHKACDVSWLAPDTRVHGLANKPNNRVYSKEDNFVYTMKKFEEDEDLLKPRERNEIQIHFRGNALRGSATMGHRMVLVVKDRESIRDIKVRVQDQMLDRDDNRDYNPDQMLFFFEDELLDDAKSLASCGIKKWNSINVVMKAGFGTHDGLFTATAGYKWRKETGPERTEHGDPKLDDHSGLDWDTRFPPDYDSSDEDNM